MPLSLQLYSMRNASDQDQVLKACAAAGVGSVEGYAAVMQDVSAFQSALSETGLKMPSAHIALDEIDEDPHGVVNRLKPLGVTKVFAPYLEEDKRPKSADGYNAIANLLAERGKIFADSGMSLGWHNHDFELETLQDGSIPMMAMFDAYPGMPWEADLGWVLRAGADPMAWLKNHSANIQAIHVKDIAAPGENLEEDGWADLGDGTANWAGIIAAAKAVDPDMLFILEHDNPSDPYRYLERSAKAFHSIWEQING